MQELSVIPRENGQKQLFNETKVVFLQIGGVHLKSRNENRLAPLISLRHV